LVEYSIVKGSLHAFSGQIDMPTIEMVDWQSSISFSIGE